ncbi:serine/threonine-protein kinase Chk1-like [Oratosquilla oratoria]|uniref:serine/threonine-protein kinase Chk1-like n=1 Tax=Oratosquilla oratoria TaxID=337810 RepID=UPI003F7671CE
MFFNKYSRLQEDLASETTDQQQTNKVQTSKKPFWKSLLCCATFFSCLHGKSSEEKKRIVVKTPGLKIWWQNKRKARKYKNTKEWTSVRQIGVGSFGRVILAENAKNGDKVAKKIIPMYFNAENFTDEVVIQFQLEHRNIINLYCWERSEYTLTIFMEYCSAGDLQSTLDSVGTKDALEYFSQLMRGVDYLHSRGVVHRDLKPPNLILTEDKVLKIADFGLADVFIVRGEEVRLSGVVGTRAYMAPEIFEESSYLGPPVDLWSCGIILVRMLGKGKPWKIATTNDEGYEMWLDKDPKLNETRPWGWIGDSSKPMVDLLLETDPVQRLSGWREFCQE